MIPSLLIDVGSPSPVYEQIRMQIAAFIRTGVLREGDRLPTVRALAYDLGIAVNTVVRAYQELQSGGFVLVARRRGTIVTMPPGDRDVSDLRQLARALVARAIELSVDSETVLALVNEAIKQPSDLIQNEPETPASAGSSLQH